MKLIFLCLALSSAALLAADLALLTVDAIIMHHDYMVDCMVQMVMKKRALNN